MKCQTARQQSLPPGQHQPAGELIAGEQSLALPGHANLSSLMISLRYAT